MSAEWQITSRVPRQGDSLELLIARLLTTHRREIVIPSSAANASRASAAIDARGFRSLLIHVDMTGPGAAGGVLPVIEAEDPASGRWSGIVSLGNFMLGNSAWVYGYGPGVGAGSGMVLADKGGLLPQRFRINMNHSSAHSHTYSVAITLIA